MQIIEEIKKGIYAHYKTTTLWTVDAIPIYQDHVPTSVAYPFICYYYIASNNTMSMPDASATTGHDYVDARIQFSLYCNDRQYTALEDYANRLEDAFHRVPLTFSNDVTHIATIVTNSRTKFYDQQQKVYTINQDYRFLAGK